MIPTQLRIALFDIWRQPFNFNGIGGVGSGALPGERLISDPMAADAVADAESEGLLHAGKLLEGKKTVSHHLIHDNNVIFLAAGTEMVKYSNIGPLPGVDSVGHSYLTRFVEGPYKQLLERGEWGAWLTRKALGVMQEDSNWGSSDDANGMVFPSASKVSVLANDYETE